MSGSIPSEMGGMRNLTYCYIYDNQLTGTVPETLGNLSELEYIDFGEICCLVIYRRLLLPLLRGQKKWLGFIS